jgi:hypothetical protein
MIAALEGHPMSDHHRRIAARIREAGLEPQWPLLQSVPGVQEISAAAILAETVRTGRSFPRRSPSARGQEFVRVTIEVQEKIEVVTPQAVTGGYEAL